MGIFSANLAQALRDVSSLDQFPELLPHANYWVSLSEKVESILTFPAADVFVSLMVSNAGFDFGLLSILNAGASFTAF
jgi:hypothetical protein